LNKAIVACFTVSDLATIQRMAESGDTEVIAVAFDLGYEVALRELHDAAVAAGAVRCHAFDVREQFTRDCILPALAAETLGDAQERVLSRARGFLSTKLAELAAFEGLNPSVDATVVGGLPEATAAGSRVLLEQHARVDIGFASGVPTSLNGIPLSLVEVLEILRTIARAHGTIDRDGALTALHTAYTSLRSSSGDGTGSVSLEIGHGAIALNLHEYTTS
jgi:argininosuccinate synthase